MAKSIEPVRSNRGLYERSRLEETKAVS